MSTILVLASNLLLCLYLLNTSNKRNKRNNSNNSNSINSINRINSCRVNSSRVNRINSCIRFTPRRNIHNHTHCQGVVVGLVVVVVAGAGVHRVHRK